MTNDQFSGFTLFEALIVTVIIGILSTIAAPNWLTFLQRQRLDVAKREVFQGMRTAQRKANQEKNTWQVTFREANQIVQWRIDPDPNSICDSETGWKNLDSRITLDTENVTFPSVSGTDNDCWRVQFDAKGRAIGEDGFYNGKITLSARNIDNKECVIISTFLGAMREDQDGGCE
jgi:prepilin-type N-terminal cleavage/methylation domain-containing protein